MIIVVPDHAHPVSIIGTYDDGKGEQLRDRLQTYSSAGFPNYPAPDADGYPGKVDVSRRLAMVFAAYPDYCDPGKPYMQGENGRRSASARVRSRRPTKSTVSRARRAKSATCRSRRATACMLQTMSC